MDIQYLEEMVIISTLQRIVQREQERVVALYLKHMNKIKERIISLGGTDIGQLEKYTQELVKQTRRIDPNKLKNKSPKEVANIVFTEAYINKLKEVIQNSKIYKLYKDKPGFFKGLFVAFLLFIAVAIINSFASVFLTMAFGSTLRGMYYTAVFVAPITEETAKQTAAKLKIGNKYIALFSWLEFLLYMFQYGPSMLAKSSAKFVKLIIVRLFGVVFHYTTMSFYKAAEVLKSKIPDKSEIIDSEIKQQVEKTKAELSDVSLKYGMFFHMLYNGIFAVLIQILLF